MLQPTNHGSALLNKTIWSKNLLKIAKPQILRMPAISFNQQLLINTPQLRPPLLPLILHTQHAIKKLQLNVLLIRPLKLLLMLKKLNLKHGSMMSKLLLQTSMTMQPNHISQLGSMVNLHHPKLWLKPKPTKRLLMINTLLLKKLLLLLKH
jgi:hypothetical protein